MTVVADQYTHVVGVDTHARTHTYVIVQTATRRQVAEETFPTSPAGIRRAIVWMTRTAPGPLLASVECTSTYGAGLETALRQAGIPAVEERPPNRAGRRAGKSDPIDARAAAVSVLGADTAMLITPRQGKTRSALRVLLAARHNMDSRRTAARNALTALVRQIPWAWTLGRPPPTRRSRRQPPGATGPATTSNKPPPATRPPAWPATSATSPGCSPRTSVACANWTRPSRPRFWTPAGSDRSPRPSS